MLELKVYDDSEVVVLQFEHSLLSLSKWESKNKKPFMSTPTKSSIEMIDYFQDMLINDVKEELVYRLSPEQLDELVEYINDQPTASSVPSDGPQKISNEMITSELVYYWLAALKIPFDPVETWHLHRLMMLIRIANYKSQPAKKQNSASMLQKWREANEARKKEFNTTG